MEGAPRGMRPRGRPREIGDDWYRVESWFPPELYAQIRGWVEVRKGIAERIGESVSKISIRTELARAWQEFFAGLPGSTRDEVFANEKYLKYTPDENLGE